MRAILATILCMSAAQAGDSAFWNGTGCQLVPVDGEAWIAEVRCRNILTPWRDQPTNSEMQAGDIAVGLSIFEGFKNIPDEFTVIPPDGFVAVPPVLQLDEDAEGIIRVYPYIGY